jgi:vancomycin resistance protein YoaR
MLQRPPQKRNEKNTKKKTAKKKVAKLNIFANRRFLLATGGVLGIFVIATVVLGIYTLSYGRIYPGVSIGGLELGGLSQTEAVRLVQESLDNRISGVVITVDDEPLALHSVPIIAAGTAEKLVDQAYEYGRTGSIFRRMGDILRRGKLDVEAQLYIDAAAIGQAIGDFLHDKHRPAVDERWEQTDEGIAVWRGQNGIGFNEALIVEEITEALTTLSGQAPASLAFSSVSVAYQTVDLQSVANAIHTEPQDARLDVDTGAILAHVNGVSMDVEAARELLNESRDNPVIIPLCITQPRVTDADLNVNLFKDTLYTATTRLIGSSATRTNNIRLAAQFMDGVIINPGDIYSFNSTVGQRTRARGFGDASIFERGTVVDGLGGGICQLTSTVYMAALFADMEIVERHPHRFAVHYTGLGQDATVFWGSLDFRFRNSTSYPIQVFSRVDGSNVIVSIKGTKENDNRVEIKTNVLSSSNFTTITEINPDMAPGATSVKQVGYNAYTSETFRHVYDRNGNLLRTDTLSRDRYQRLDRIIETGPPGNGTAAEPPEPEPTPYEPEPPPPTAEPTPYEPVPPPTAEPTPYEPVPTPSPEPTPEPPPYIPDQIPDSEG